MRASFIHRGGVSMASYRYRALIPAQTLEYPINDLSADILVYAKPAKNEISEMLEQKALGKRIVVDFCDDHFVTHPHYEEAALLADSVTCPTVGMSIRIRKHGYVGTPTVIPDPYELPEVLPHCSGNRVLWFGHAVNFASLIRVLPRIGGYPLKIVSNVPGSIPWSMDTILREFIAADMVIIPATADYKSPNRAVEAIRQGCFVVAEPHPSLNDIPGIWIGDIKEGIEWAMHNQESANKRTRLAQVYIQKYSPRTVACAWNCLFQNMKSRSISDAVIATGMDGRISTCTANALT